MSIVLALMLAVAPMQRPRCPCAQATCPCSIDCGCGCTTVKGYRCDCSQIIQADATYQHLPKAAVCEAQYRTAQLFRSDLETRLAFVDGGRDPSGWDFVGGAAGGWDAVKLRAQIREAQAVEDAWFACWWVVWPTATADERSYWEAKLRRLIGDRAYVTGQLPCPISR